MARKLVTLNVKEVNGYLVVTSEPKEVVFMSRQFLRSPLGVYAYYNGVRALFVAPNFEPLVYEVVEYDRGKDGWWLQREVRVPVEMERQF